MANIIQQFKSINAFINGVVLQGTIDGFEPPTVTSETEEFRAGGMDGYVDVETGQEKMECSLMTKGIQPDIIGAWCSGKPDTRLEVRGALENYDGTVKSVVYEMTGLVTTIEHDELQGRGELPRVTLTMNPNFYKMTLDGEVKYEIDVVNNQRIIDGTDRLAEIRAAIGS